MDTSGYSKWGSGFQENLSGPWERWGCRALLLALVLSATAVLWVVILSVLLSKASTECGLLHSQQNQLETNVSKLTMVLGALQEEFGANKIKCQSTQVQLQTASKELKEAQGKLLEQQSALRDLKEQMTQGLAEASRDREDIRTELFRMIESIQSGNASCEQCPTSWLPFQGSCYLFSREWATWDEAQKHCLEAGGHLVIIGGMNEQSFLVQHIGDRGHWLGLRAVRQRSRIQSYQWVDGVPLSFSHWNRGEPSDSQGREDCIMMLNTGLWNDAPCTLRDNWICEKRRTC
ncbi:C-type lectin domain family 4 member G-like [Erinaceus europaeus]|uniref:C-type lectin domain family 4 member G-like n=1 Tax=Erinaceus europaeus TaxID=9365 RepID=A0ABM3WLE6_ERIEU|nr:C-type lectin domain family 4 member G-like [Erinaceus europaeus]